MVLKYGNFVDTTLALAAPAAAGTITLTSVPADFPTVGAGNTTLLVLEQGTMVDPTQQEIVLVTSRTGLVLSVTRGQDGTTAQDFDPGDRVSLRLVAGFYNSLSNAADVAGAAATVALGAAATAQAAATLALADAVTANSDATTLAAPQYLVWSQPQSALSADRRLNAPANSGIIFTPTAGIITSTSDPAIVPAAGSIFVPLRFTWGHTGGMGGTLQPAGGVTTAMYLGRADKTYSSAVVRFSLITQAITTTWTELGVASGAASVGADATLTSRGWVSIVSQVGVPTGIKTATISLSGVTLGMDLWLVVGSAGGTGPFLRAYSVVDQIGCGIVQTATVRPQSISGTAFTLSTTVLGLWAAVELT